MKKNDIALLILIVSISLIASFVILKAIVGDGKNNLVKADVVEPITSQVVTPDPAVFNKNAINPTVKIQIGDSANKQPFVKN